MHPEGLSGTADVSAVLVEGGPEELPFQAPAGGLLPGAEAAWVFALTPVPDGGGRSSASATACSTASFSSRTFPGQAYFVNSPIASCGRQAPVSLMCPKMCVRSLASP